MKKTEGIISILTPIFCRLIPILAGGRTSAVTAFDRNEKLIYILAAVFTVLIIISICVDRAVKVKRKKKRRRYGNQKEDSGEQGKSDLWDLDAEDPERADDYDMGWARGEGNDDYDIDDYDADWDQEEDEDGYDIDWRWAREEGKDNYDIDWRWEEDKNGYDIELRWDESSGHYDVEWGGDIEYLDLAAEPGLIFSGTAKGSESPVISVQDVTMIFQISTSNASSVKEYLIQQIKGQVTFSDLTALDHISFDVFKGEVVGIIGTNGSGKSTLLRIVSGALTPSGGRVMVDRKKVQLLTLGTGFDMELSARENVYLNGSIIGYSKEFLDAHYEEIVEFAELRDFMEEKVKNFSSGMVSRLGFAIATAGDAAEILILDEVLSVGDEFFRKKSLARIKEMIHGGSTVLMVSHSMGTILENCTKVVWIEKGKMMMVGEAKEVCGLYQRMKEVTVS